jgi:hypothetical protein
MTQAGLAVLFASLMLSACSGGTIFKQSAIGDVEVLSIDARQRLVLNGRDQNGKRIVCSEPSPDAIAAQAAALAASGASPNGVNAGLAASLSESVGSIAMRTQTIQLLRDGYFRICEARLNGQIDEDEYQRTLRFIDEFIVAVSAIEALGGRVVAPAITIGAKGNASVTSGQPSSNSDAAGPAQIGQVTVNANDMSDAQAAAVATIVELYFARKQRYLKEMAAYK